MAEYTYRAFISYSWADAKWGKWLQHVIETYHTPKALIEKHAGVREIPARLTPLFKDREEQAAGASIGASIEAALADSEYLIVICSPNSAQSQWVNHEIAWFKKNRDPDKVLALIVAGEPGDEAQECFPKALTHKIAPDLTITDEPDEAPLAADAREGGDGKRLAKMKLVAAMLGVGLDQLLRRDDRRRDVRARMIAGASMALALVMSGLTWFAVEQRNEAEFQRDQAETLIENSLTEMRDQLEPVGRLDLLEGLGSRALEYYAAQKLDALDADALGRRARAMLLVGEVSNIRGNSDEALQAFTEAAATTQEQLAREPDNEQRIFDHAQSVFWVGAIAYGRGELEDAEAQFRDYKRLADQLVELNPEKPEWQMESSYADNNLGVMFLEQRRYQEAEPAFENGLNQIQSVARREPYNEGRQVEVGNTINWLGIVKDALGKHREALQLHKQEVDIYEEILGREPTNTMARNRLAIALQHLSDLQLDLGKLDDAVTTADRSLKLNSELRLLEPENTEWQETAVRALHLQSDLLLLAGNLDSGQKSLDEAQELLARMVSTDPENEFWKNQLTVSEAMVSARFALSRGRLSEAEEILNNMHARDAVDAPETKAQVHLLAGDVASSFGDASKALTHWREALSHLAPEDVTGLKYALLERTGQSAEAERLAIELERRGYRNPAYLPDR